MLKFVTLTILALGLAACSNYDPFKSGEFLYDNTGGGNSILSQTSTIDWSLVQGSVLNTCTDCHAGKQNPLLTSYTAVQENISTILSKVSSNAMPPASEGFSPLSACQVAVLQEWVNAGEPLTSTVTVSSLAACAGVGAGTGTGGGIQNQPLSYQVLLTQILQPYCIKCHNANDPSNASMYIFNPYSAMQADTKNWNAPGASSVAAQKLQATDNTRMPPLPNAALTAEQINYIIRWIDAGKPQ